MTEWYTNLKIGDYVCDCRYRHSKVISFTDAGGGDLILNLDDNYSCSARHCCSPADHPPHWWVYMVRCKDKTLYTGITNNLQKRIAKHNAGKGAKYTKARRPVKLVKSVIVETKSQALKLEHQIKQLSREEKLKFIAEK